MLPHKIWSRDFKMYCETSTGDSIVLRSIYSSASHVDTSLASRASGTSAPRCAFISAPSRVIAAALLIFLPSPLLHFGPHHVLFGAPIPATLQGVGAEFERLHHGAALWHEKGRRVGMHEVSLDPLPPTIVCSVWHVFSLSRITP